MTECYLRVDHQPHDDESRSECWVTSLGHYISRRHRLESRCWDQTVLIYCRHGGGALRLGDKQYAIHASEVFFVPAHVDHGYWCDPSSGWDILWLVYGGAHAVHLTSWVGLTVTHPVCKLDDPTDLQSRWKSCYHLTIEKTAGYGLRLANEVVSLLYDLKRSVQPSPAADWDWLHQFAVQARSLDELAERMGCSTTHLIRRFKRETGQTPWAYILSVKLNRAKVLLLDPTLSIAHIAHTLGFDDPNYFSRLFRNTVGVNPRVYREATWHEMGIHVRGKSTIR